ncbi:MAG: transglycosylase domain-containing protein, partial [Bdellovibrionota bacterium]
LRGLLRALWVDIKTLSLAQGGSTITNQLVKNLNERRGKNIFTKANEILLAIILEIKFTKEEILEKYLNEVYLGQVGGLEIHGVSEGAQHFFGKKLGELSLAETALLAGVIRGPFYYSPFRHLDRAIERQRLVLQKMVETGQIAEEEAKAAATEPIQLAPMQRASNKAPFFVDFVRAELTRQLKDRLTEEEIEKSGFRIYTTLDPYLNTQAQLAVELGVSDLEKRHKLSKPYRLEGALASVDQANGYVRALVGGRNYAESNFNRTLNMRRQVGSTFKPVVYLSAFLKGRDEAGVPYGPAYPMEDAPWTLIYDRKKQKWSPKNYEKENLGWIPLRTALAHSVNIISAKLGFALGLPLIIDTARKLGIDSPLPEVPALSLGVAELTPVELLQIYATIANHGERDQLTVIRGITRDDGTGYARFVYHPNAVLPPAPCDLMTDLLTSVFTEGTAKIAYDMGFDRPAAGKTGTTS